MSDIRAQVRMEARRRARRSRRPPRRQYRADAGHGPQGGHQLARVGANKLWAGTVHIHPNAKTGAHHHGPLESVIYVVKGRARMRWGEALEFVAEAGPGDFIYVPPFVPHQEINASPDQTLECVLVRSDGEAVAVNLDIEPAEAPEAGALDRPDPSAGLTAHAGPSTTPTRRSQCLPAPEAGVGLCQNVSAPHPPSTPTPCPTTRRALATPMPMPRLCRTCRTTRPL